MSHSFVLNHKTALAQISTSSYFAIAPGFIIDVPTTIGWDNYDSSAETLTSSGNGATHISGGIIQRKQSTTTEL